MSPALLSLVALLTAIVLSCTTRINVGVLSMAFAWVIGTYVVGWTIDQVMGGFPESLFLTLTGVTLLFALAETNGTLERVANRAIQLAGGHPRLVPIAFFIAAALLSSVGPGAVSTVALLIPLAMAIGLQGGTPRLLTALMIANGANAGNLSPVTATGVIANSRMTQVALGGHAGKVWFANFAAHAVVATVAYLLFSRLSTAAPASLKVEAPKTALNKMQVATALIITAWIVGVVAFDLSVGLGAFAAAALLLFIDAADETSAIKRLPWGIIIMVSGVTMLIDVLEKTGGMDLFTGLLAKLAGPSFVDGTIAFVTGLISSWSNTSGVVLPAFLPTVPHLVARIGGGNPLAVALSITVGSSLVDVSPLSALGALCVATVSDATDARVLFRQLLAWGLSMTIVGALLCQAFAGAIARF